MSIASSRRASALALVASVALSNFIAATPALASEAATERSVKVEYADLDLDTAKGVKRLYARIRKAASEVCGARSVVGTRLPSTDWTVCYERAITSAVQSLELPALTAYHSARLGAKG